MIDSDGVTYNYRSYRGKNYYGHSTQIRSFEDKIKSTIFLDLLNTNNMFHEVSDITKRLYSRLKN